MWTEVLQQADYPKTVIVLDFETYYDTEYSMGPKRLSTIEYIQDKRFEILGVGLLTMKADYPFKEYEQGSKFWSHNLGMIVTLQDLYGQNLERCTVVVQNAIFDAGILAYRYGIYPPYIIDTLSLARHWCARSKHGLADLCKQWGLKDKGDTKEFAGLSAKFRFVRQKNNKPPIRIAPSASTAPIWVNLARYCENDIARTWEVFTLLLPRLSNPHVELPLMQRTLELFTKPQLEFDSIKAEILERQIRGEMNADLEAVSASQKEISGTISFDRLMTKALEDAGESPLNYMKTGKKGMLLALAKGDEGRKKLLTHYNERVRNLIKARLSVKSWPLHISRIDNMQFQAIAAKGKLPIALKYYGAHTGRWSGGEKINPQNLGGKGDNYLINGIRKLIIAPEGYKLVIADAAQIEARVLAWLAGQDDLVEQFRQNIDAYSALASKVLGKTVRKAKDGELDYEEMKEARGFGKVGVLGCGYGMGAEQMKIYAATPPFNLELTDGMARRIVDSYRKTNPMITLFWQDIEDAFRFTAHWGRPGKLRNLAFSGTKECHVQITLPSGRMLYYHKVRLVNNGIEVWNDLHNKWEYTWGGSLTENVVQAIARDILAESWLRLEAAGIHVALTVHDELVSVIPETQTQHALQASLFSLSAPPIWAKDLPLSAEGKIADRYGEH